MRRSIALGGCLLLCAVVPGVLAACGLDLSGNGPLAMDASVTDASEAGVPESSTMDTSAVDAGADANEAGVPESGLPEAGCSGVICNGMCANAGDCRSCNGAALLCGSTRVCMSSCEGCTDTSGTVLPVQCFACDSNHINPIGTCQYDDAGSYCLNGDYLGQYQGDAGYQCSCTDGGVSSCPGPTQVCVPLGHAGQSFCLNCGEPTVGAIQGMPCQDGGLCQESVALCQ